MNHLDGRFCPENKGVIYSRLHTYCLFNKIESRKRLLLPDEYRCFSWWNGDMIISGWKLRSSRERLMYQWKSTLRSALMRCVVKWSQKNIHQQQRIYSTVPTACELINDDQKKFYHYNAKLLFLMKWSCLAILTAISIVTTRERKKTIMTERSYAGF
jgi:hypothetical protein